MPLGKVSVMGVGVSLFLITLGAILKFAITVRLVGVNLQAIGVILMVVGAFWFVVTLIFMRRRRPEDPADQTYDDGGPPAV